MYCKIYINYRGARQIAWLMFQTLLRRSAVFSSAVWDTRQIDGRHFVGIESLLRIQKGCMRIEKAMKRTVAAVMSRK
jgi:hypothetical protein